MDLIYTSDIIMIRSHFMGGIMPTCSDQRWVEMVFFTDTRPETPLDSEQFSALQKSAGLPPNGPASLSVCE